MTPSSRMELEEQVRTLGTEQAWNHAIELPHGVWTADPQQSLPGKNRLKWERLRPVVEGLGVSGRRVLDLGCNEGFFSVQMSRAGAGEIVGCDIGAPRLKKAAFVMSALGLSNVTLRELSVFDPEFRSLGRFDLALCLGFLHRVPNPFGVIETLASMADVILFEWKAYPLGTRSQPLLAYDGRLSLADDPHSRAYFRPSVASVVAMLADCGVTHHRVIDEGPGQRVLLLAGHRPLPVATIERRQPGRLRRLYLYSRWYAGRVRDLMRGDALS